jgi:hypothetical protein
MWKPEHRLAADRRGLRYHCDLTDREWALVAPFIRPAKRGGHPRTVNVREVLNAIFYVPSKTRDQVGRTSWWMCPSGSRKSEFVGADQTSRLDARSLTRPGHFGIVSGWR